MTHWKDIPSCPGYVASSEGKIGRVLPTGHVRVLRPYVRSKRDVRGRGSYLTVSISIRNVRRSAYVHRLVCEAFHGPPPSSSHQACHGPLGATSNDPQNLRWGTPEENQSEVLIYSGDDWYRARGQEPPHAFEGLL